MNNGEEHRYNPRAESGEDTPENNFFSLYLARKVKNATNGADSRRGTRKASCDLISVNDQRRLKVFPKGDVLQSSCV